MTTPSLGRIGYGSMNLTWKPNVAPDEQAFATIKTALESGSTMLNGGEFYGVKDQPSMFANLDLFSRFFAKYPEWAEPGKCFLSIKGGLRFSEEGHPVGPDSSEEFLRESVDNINAHLLGSGGKKRMDLFEMARVDKTRPIEDQMGTLKKLVGEGKFGHIGLSECSADTIRKAAKVHPVAAVEVEYSLWSLDVERNGVLQACKDLNIPLVAYSPLGRGMLTGTIRKPSDIPPGDMRHRLDRFRPENFDKNLELVDKIEALAAKKGVTPTQLALAWLVHQSPVIVPIPGSTRVEGVKESLGALDVRLSEEELAEIRKVAEGADVRGGRYNDQMAPMLEG